MLKTVVWAVIVPKNNKQVIKKYLFILNNLKIKFKITSIKIFKK
jgi:hypothetical protein